MPLADTAATVFDLVFAIGFAFLAVMFILDVGITGKSAISGLPKWVLIGYYCFFCMFMTLAFLKNSWLLKYCGFLKGFLTKTLFYVFLSSLAFPSLTAWPCLVTGSIFFAMSIFNLFRYFGCCKAKEGEASK